MTEWQGNKQELQKALERCTDYAFKTGDTSIYNKPSYKDLKAQLVAELERDKLFQETLELAMKGYALTLSCNPTELQSKA